MNRRKFLILILSSLALVVMGLLFFLKIEDVVKRVLKSELAKLNINEDELARFVIGIKSDGTLDMIFYNFQRRTFFILYFFISKSLIDLPYQNKYDDLKAQLVGLFLLSSNYFLESKNGVAPVSIRYLAVYNPYRSACYNPFAASHG